MADADGVPSIPQEKGPGAGGNRAPAEGRSRSPAPGTSPLAILGGDVREQCFLAVAYRDAKLGGWASQALEKAELWLREAIEAGSAPTGDDLSWDERLWLETLVKQARARPGQ